MYENLDPQLDRPYTLDSDDLSYGSSCFPVKRERKVSGWRGWLLGETETYEAGSWHTAIYVGGQVAYSASGEAESHAAGWDACQTVAKAAWVERNDRRPSHLKLVAEIEARRKDMV